MLATLSVADSSWIEHVAYDAEHHELTVVTKKGDTMIYTGVPAPVWSDLQAAPSKGGFISHKVIRVYPRKAE